MKFKKIKKILKEKKAFPSKKLGQNFLVSEKILKKIVKIANLNQKETVLEIGPGVGNLTQELAKKAKKVIAVEKDEKMVEIAKEVLKNFKNVEIVLGDILKLSNKDLKLDGNYKLVANLPFYLTGAVIKKFLEEKLPPKEMILMVQKEVAERICAFGPKMNLLALSVQFYGKPSIEFVVPKKFFWPRPKVDAAIVKISKIEGKKEKKFKEAFFKLVKIAFSHPRKQLINNLVSGLKIDKIKIKEWLLKNDIDPRKRAEDLNFKDWLNLTNTISFIQTKKS